MAFFIAAAAAVKIVPWIVGLIGSVYATKKITQVFGSTPANDIKRIPGMEGMNPKQIYNDRKEWRQDRIKYHEKRNKKIDEQIKIKNEQIEKLEEKITKVAEQAKNTDDPTEKNRLIAVMEGYKKDVKDLKGEIKGLKENKDEGEKKVDEIYKGFDDNLTQEQFINKSSSINWTSYRNYAIIFFCVIVLIMIIGFIKKLLDSFLKSMK